LLTNLRRFQKSVSSNLNKDNSKKMTRSSSDPNSDNFFTQKKTRKLRGG